MVETTGGILVGEKLVEGILVELKLVEVELVEGKLVEGEQSCFGEDIGLCWTMTGWLRGPKDFGSSSSYPG